MRIITGKSKGCVLKTLSGDDTRPTTDRVKEALFSSLQFDIEGRRILDLFAGSGQLGIECLSRNAKSACFVDSNPLAVSIIKENLKHSGLEDNSSVHNVDSYTFINNSNDIYDIVFLDPPYNSDLLDRILPVIEKNMSSFGIIVCEHPINKNLPNQFDSFFKTKNGKYGKIGVTIYRREINE